MTDSILDSVKRALGLDPNYPPFDEELIMDINTILSVVNQLGVGVVGFSIEDSSATWDEFLATEQSKGIKINEVRTYVAKRVQMIFDPPTGAYMEALKEVIKELEFRITVAIETPLNQTTQSDPEPEFNDTDEDF